MLPLPGEIRAAAWLACALWPAGRNAAAGPRLTTSDHHQRDKRDLVRGSIMSISGFLMRMASRVPFLFIAGQLYGTARYGDYVLATALVESAAVFGTFGFKLTLFKFLH